MNTTCVLMPYNSSADWNLQSGGCTGHLPLCVGTPPHGCGARVPMCCVRVPHAVATLADFPESLVKARLHVAHTRSTWTGGMYVQLALMGQ